MSWARLGIVAIFGGSLTAVVLSIYRFRLEPTWRMDPIPFAFFLVAAAAIGWAVGRTSTRRATKRERDSAEY